jgi:hypothetical protein
LLREQIGSRLGRTSRRWLLDRLLRLRLLQR